MAAEVMASGCVYVTHVLFDRFDIGQPQRHCDSNQIVVRGLESTCRGVSDLGYAVMAAPHSSLSAHTQRPTLSSYFMKQSQFEIFQRKFQGKRVCSNTGEIEVLFSQNVPSWVFSFKKGKDEILSLFEISFSDFSFSFLLK